MMGNLSSYIELFAAVYLTISLDDLLLKRFWTPDYRKDMENSFQSISMPEVAKEQTLDKSIRISSLEESRSRKRGAILFGYSILLLILIGLEGCFTFSGKNIEAIGISLYAALIIAIFLFDGLLLRTGWQVLISSFMTPSLVIIICLLLSSCPRYTKWLYMDATVNVKVFTSCIIVITMLAPVLWQLFRNWLYTRYYLLYVVEQTTIKAKEYNYAVSYDHSKGDKMTKVAQPYIDYVADVMAQGGQDRMITPFLNTLLDELSKINFVPKLFSLVRHSYKMHQKYFPSGCRVGRLSKRYNAMKANGKKPTLEDFCFENNIDVLLIRKYRKEHNMK